jgi:ATP-dependent DNA helicase DinG
MREAWAALAPSWPWPTLLQGEAGKEALLARFRETPDAVLFATQTFWEGVDVPGRALSLLVIDRLPFESPGDPLVDARIQALRRAGANPFETFQLPRAATALRQGLGRLIRHRSDRGLAAILDPRLWHARYGAALRAELPPFEVTADLARVAAFWRGDSEGPDADAVGPDSARSCGAEPA